MKTMYVVFIFMATLLCLVVKAGRIPSSQFEVSAPEDKDASKLVPGGPRKCGRRRVWNKHCQCCRRIFYQGHSSVSEAPSTFLQFSDANKAVHLNISHLDLIPVDFNLNDTYVVNTDKPVPSEVMDPITNEPLIHLDKAIDIEEISRELAYPLYTGIDTIT